jgi:hypothetical protein
MLRSIFCTDLFLINFSSVADDIYWQHWPELLQAEKE